MSKLLAQTIYAMLGINTIQNDCSASVISRS